MKILRASFFVLASAFLLAATLHHLAHALKKANALSQKNCYTICQTEKSDTTVRTTGLDLNPAETLGILDVLSKLGFWDIFSLVSIWFLAIALTRSSKYLAQSLLGIPNKK